MDLVVFEFGVNWADVTGSVTSVDSGHGHAYECERGVVWSHWSTVHPRAFECEGAEPDTRTIEACHFGAW